jgi:ketosteroid isomerase-like protein
VNKLLIALALGCVSAPGVAAPAASVAASPQAAVEELLAADRAFSAASAATNLVDGIAAMLDETVVMPAPDATFAKGKEAAIAVLKGTPANVDAKAEWAPVRGGISADGQHGFTFGYMTIRKDGAPDRQAKYLSYWVKRPAGWRVAAYKRVPRPDGQGTAPMAPVLPAKLVRPAKDPALVETLGKSLAAAEQSFSDEAQKIGLGAAFRKNGRADAMNMGREAAFTIGAEAIGAGFGGDTASPLNWSADDVIVASSGDLGVTIGMIRANAPPPEGRPAAVPFFTIWYRSSTSEPWRYVAE